MHSTTLSQEILEICKRLHLKNMLAAADGNVSYRVSDREILITPAGRHKGFIVTKDLAVITIDNEIVSGHPSSERLMHLQLYRRVPEAKCVVHAHPPTAIAWSVAKPQLKELPSECLSEVILAVGSIPIVPYARPGTDQMGANLLEFLPQCRALILARHGAITWGESLEEAYNGMERLEHSAQILKGAVELGGLTSLPKEEVDFLRATRSRVGEKLL